MSAELPEMSFNDDVGLDEGELVGLDVVSGVGILVGRDVGCDVVGGARTLR